MYRNKVVVIGSANADLVIRVPSCPRPGQSLVGESFTVVPGGKGANQAVAAARLGAHTVFGGCIGDDAFGGLVRDSLVRSGIDVSCLRVHPDAPTGTAVIFVERSGENSIVVTPAANLQFTPADVQRMEMVIAHADVLLVQLEVPISAVETALDLARRHGVLTLLDAGPARRVEPEVLAKADVVSPNETETEYITGIRCDSLEGATRAARALIDAGVKEVVLKLGRHGSLYAGEEILHVPAFEIAPVDTVAAGDAFTAALGLVWGLTPRDEALRFANAAGALAALAPGAQPAMPTRDAVESFLEERGVKP